MIALTLATLLLFALLLNAAPVAFAMLVAGAAGIAMLNGYETAIAVIRSTPYEHVANYGLSTIPMFIVMAEVLTGGRFTKDIFDSSYKWLSSLHGALAYAVVLGGAMLAAVSGSSTASAATLAGAAYPEMKKYRYEDAFSTGVMAISGTLAIMIPPSIALILFGILTETSVSALFLAGIVPGILTLFGYAIAIRVTLARNPNLAPIVTETFSLQERLASLLGLIPILLLMMFLFASLYSGAATVTEIGALSAVFAVLLALVMRRAKLRDLFSIFARATQSSAMIMMIVACAAVFGVFITISGVAQDLLNAVQELGLNRWVALGIVLAVILILGFFLDQLAIMVLTLPLVAPVLQQLDFNMIWFGILFVKTAEIGLITPPMGLNCFVVSSVTGVPVHVVFRGIWWLLLLELILLLALICVPDLTLYIPRLAGAGV